MGGSLRVAAAAVVSKVRSSPWATIGGRVAFVGLALLLLAWIGRASAEPEAHATTPQALPSAIATGAMGTTSATSMASDAVDAAGTSPSPAEPAPAAPAPASRTRASASDPVYLNEADTDELRRLPGVGAKRADAILAHRRRIGRFQRVEDLMRVKGIGRATIRKWRPLVRLEIRKTDAGASLQ